LKKFQHFMEQKVHYRVHSSLPLARIPSYMNPSTPTHTSVQQVALLAASLCFNPLLILQL
jgi:hypothetical protein